MTTLAPPIALDDPLGEPFERRWTRDEYYRLAAQGFFDGQRVELIDGRVILMPPQGNNHDVAITLCQRILTRAFGDAYWVRPQMSLDLSPLAAPEPDVAVVRGLVEETIAKPRTAVLVLEVSETTLTYDRGFKQRLYASSNIADYWIVNLNEWQLEVHRNPVADAQGNFTHRYRDVRYLRLHESIAPLALPAAPIEVAKLLPPVRNAK